MKILNFRAENVKRLSVVEIKPDGAIVEIAGKNGHGKTSVLDSVAWVLGGESLMQSKPIRKGQDKAVISVEIGDADGVKYLVTRTIREAPEGAKKAFTSELKIVEADGSKPKGPQALLDALLGPLTLDPVEFIRCKPSERIDTLKALIPDIDFDDLAKKRQELFDGRTDVNRDEKRSRAAAATIDIPAGTPKDLIDVSKLMTGMEEIGTFNADIAERQSNRDALARTALADRDMAAERDTQISALRDQIARLESERDALIAKANAADEKLAGLPALPAPKDAASIRAEIEEANRVNRLVALHDAKAAHISEADRLKAKSEKMTGAIEAIDKKVADAVANSKLPVSGLSLGAEDVMLDGLPFEQASDAKQLRVSMAIAMAGNPDLRLIRIRDGSLLDGDAMAILAEVAEADDFQIWIERVIASGPSAIIMEDGHIKGAGFTLE